ARLASRSTLFPYTTLFRSRSVAGVIYVASRGGVHKSDDGGTTWRAVNRGLASLNIRSLVQSPTDPKTLYAGTNGSGLYRSRDSGGTWVSMPPVRSAN